MLNWREASGLLIDLDGTLFRGSRPLQGALEFMQIVQREEIPYVYWTNNSTRTPEEVAVHLASLGFVAPRERVYSSAMAISAALLEDLQPGARVFVLGEGGLRTELARSFTVIGPEEEGADAVAMGLDRFATYARFRAAVHCLLDDALFVASNSDRLFPEEDGYAPGAGALLALLETACGRPARVVGKPSPEFVRSACEQMGVAVDQAIIIGDNPETDIAAAHAAGARGILVETGVHARMSALSVRADLAVRDLGVLAALPLNP